MADNLDFCLTSDSLCPVDLSDNRDTCSADVFVFIVPAAASFFFIRDAPATFFFQDLIPFPEFWYLPTNSFS